MAVTIHPLAVPAVLGPGLDLPGTLRRALADATPPVELVDGDVVVVASKVVALAEGRLVDLPAQAGSADPRRPLARAQARRVVADDPRVLVVETHHGLVCANAGIDTSNVPPGSALLLPADPDASAAALRADLLATTGADVGVVVTDTFGRPWRMGQVDVAIGSAGISPLRDERGTTDLHGRTLEVTVAAVADEIAAAADLVRAKASPVPFVLVRGLDVAGTGTAHDLVREAAEDLFPAGGATMADHVVTRVGRAPADPGHIGRGALVPLATAAEDHPDPVARVLAMALDRDARTAGVVATVEQGPERTTIDLVASGDTAGWVAVGRVVARLEVLAFARGWDPTTTAPGQIVVSIA